MNQLVVGEMGLSGKWLVGETEFGETSFRRRGIRRNGVGEMGVDETAVGEMTCNLTTFINACSTCWEVGLALGN